LWFGHGLELEGVEKCNGEPMPLLSDGRLPGRGDAISGYKWVKMLEKGIGIRQNLRGAAKYYEMAVRRGTGVTSSNNFVHTIFNESITYSAPKHNWGCEIAFSRRLSGAGEYSRGIGGFAL
jgi:hypothetical protein